MKALFLLLAFVVLGITANAQRVLTDTITNTEVVSFTSMQAASQVQVLFTNLTGTSAGTAILKGSVDNITFVTLAEKAGEFHFYPGDTLTILDGAGWLINIVGQPFLYYKVVATGSGTATTLVEVKWAK